MLSRMFYHDTSRKYVTCQLSVIYQQITYVCIHCNCWCNLSILTAVTWFTVNDFSTYFSRRWYQVFYSFPFHTNTHAQNEYRYPTDIETCCKWPWAFSEFIYHDTDDRTSKRLFTLFVHQLTRYSLLKCSAYM